MRNTSAWRELYRSNNLLEARAVATSIAAMEYDVRLTATGAWPDEPRDRFAESQTEGEPIPGDLAGPFVIEVPGEHWLPLSETLGDIIDEQREFDELLEWRKHRHQRGLMVVLAIVTTADVLIVWKLIDS